MYTYLPDLLVIELLSFQKFIEKAMLREVLSGLHGLTAQEYPYGNLVIDPNAYKFALSKIQPEQAITERRTFGGFLYIPMWFSKFTHRTPHLVTAPEYNPEQPYISTAMYYCLGYLPLMTDEAYFVVNGVRRVVINQMVRCPNLYCKIKVLSDNKRTYLVSCVSDRGAWLRLERDKKGKVWVRINEFAKIPFFVFTTAIGLTYSLLKTLLGNLDPFSESIQEGYPTTRAEALFILGNLLALPSPTLEKKYSRIRPDAGIHRSRDFLGTKLFSNLDYSLSISGRARINQRFQGSSYLQSLQPEDILAAIYTLRDLELNKIQVDDIDHLKNRRVRMISDLLGEQMRRGVKRLREEKGIFVKTARGEHFELGHTDQVTDETLPPLEICYSHKTFPAHIRTFVPWFSKKMCAQRHTSRIYIRHTSLSSSIQNRTTIYQNKNLHLKQATMVKRVHTISPKQAPQECLNRKRRRLYTHILLSRDRRQTHKIHIQQRFITRTFSEFFGLGQLSHYMDQINPLSSLTQKRRLTCLGPGGVSRQSGLDIRDIHPSHYGRICPIETPEGKNAGLVNSLASYAQISHSGAIESLYTSVFGKTSKQGTVQVSALQQKQPIFYPFYVGSSGNLHSTHKQLAHVQTPTGQIIPHKDARFVSVSPTAMISIATCLIPFLEHDDGNRALMASNMQRQAVPLVYTERPIVGTGFESCIARDSRTVITSPVSGWVEYVDSCTIHIRTTPFSGLPIPLHAASNHQDRNSKKNGLSASINGSPTTIKTYHIPLCSFSRSNHNTLVYQSPAVKAQTPIEQGMLLADTSTTYNGELSLGKNLLVAYMPWEGYNFEDAVVLNQQVVTRQSFTSIHIERCETQTKVFDTYSEEFYIPKTRKGPFLYDTHGIIRPGCHIVEGDILVGKKAPMQQILSPAERLLFAIFNQKNLPRNRDCSFYAQHGIHGRIFETFFSPHSKRTKIQSGISGHVCLHILIKRAIQIGDKVAGRHGNKGIISNILPSCDMPYLQTGKTIDIVLNPLGVPSRMNVGQIFECLLGLAGLSLQEYYRVRAFDEIYGPKASQILVYSQFVRAQQLVWWLSTHPTTFGKTRVFDGRTGNLYEYPITVGLAYILKLIHLVDDKIHARSIGKYALLTQQPLKGRSKKGGQRVGEMEVWALQGFSASYILQEMLTLKSDDRHGRTLIHHAMTSQTHFPQADIPESFRTLTSELRGLCFDLDYKAYTTRDVQNWLVTPKIVRKIFVPDPSASIV